MLMFTVSLSSVNTNAETTYVAYDLNLQAHTVTADQITEVAAATLENGNRVVTIFKCSEYGTTMYYGTDGKIQKVKNTATGQIIKDFTVDAVTQIAETTVKVVTPTTKAVETTTAKAQVWNTKVTGLKKKTVKKTYKAYRSIYDKKMSKIKYTYGYKISWKKKKGAKGYVLQRYAPAQKKWVTIKTTKKTSYTLTNISSAKVTLRVKAYKTKNGKKIYSKASKKLKFKSDYCTKLNKYGFQVKDYFFDQFSAEEVFIEQNEARKKEGSQPLKWSNTLYKIGVYRLKKSGFDAHKNMTSDIYDYAKSQGLKNLPNGFVGSDSKMGYSENLLIGLGPSEMITGWERSDGHYRNMINPEHVSGAIAYMCEDGGMIAIGAFSNNPDVDSYWNSFK